MSSTPNNNNNGNEKLSINDNISAAPVNVKKKKSLKKSLNGTQSTNNNNNNINSYEHHLEKWIENTSKMNFDYSNENNYNNFHLMNSSFQQPYRNISSNNNINNNRNHLQHQQQQQQQHQHSSTMMDPNTSLPSQQFNSSIDTSPSISSFLNFNTSFKQQYPHLLHQRQQSSSSISNDPLASLNTQQEFFSLPSLGLNKLSDKLNTSTDQEKLNDVINQTRRFSDLLIDDTPLSNMNVSNNSNIRPLNESSVEDDEDDDQETDEEEETQPQMNGNQSKVPTENGGNGNNNGSGNLNNKTLLVSLLKQINLLHETNSKIFRNLHETKVEMEALKYAPSWGLRHRRDSVSGLSVHSQPYGFGGNSPAPTYHSQGNYTPGVVTDLIREVRDASRVRDESLLNRVKVLIDEKSWSLNEANLRVLRELEEIKIHIHTLKLEKQNTNDRLHKLEDEVRSMRGFMGTNNIPFSPVQYAQFPATSNSNIAMSEQLKRSNLNLNYGVINSTSDNYPYDDHQQQQPQQQQQNFHPNDYMKMKRSSLPSYMPQQLQQQLSPPKRQMDNSMNNSASEIIDEETFDGSHVMQMEKDTLKLRRDLQDALAGRKMAESRILALEHMVTSLKTPTNHHHLNNNTNNNHSMSSEILLQQQLQHLQTNGGSHETKRRNSSTQMEQLTLNTSTGSGTTTKMSSPKPQKASQIIITANPSGPVTDL